MKIKKKKARTQIEQIIQIMITHQMIQMRMMMFLIMIIMMTMMMMKNLVMENNKLIIKLMMGIIKKLNSRK
jgi:hypothetical protein